MQFTPLTNEQIRSVAPSVFATAPWEQVSDRYQFVPTFQVIDALREEGFMPVRAMQSRTRIPGKRDFTKHMLRFRSVNIAAPSAVGDSVPEIVLTNSHDRRRCRGRGSGYKLDLGIFRMVCSNGLVVKSSDYGSMQVPHFGKDVLSRIIEGTYHILDDAESVMDKVQNWGAIRMADEERMLLAETVHEYLYPKADDRDHPAPFAPGKLLNVRRHADIKHDLWTTTNVIQENVIRGGIRGFSSSGRRTRTRAVTSVNSELSLNKAIWAMAEKFAELKSVQ